MKRMTEISQSENKDQHAAIPTETKVQNPRKNQAKQKGKESTNKDRNLNKKIGTTNDKKKQNSNLVCTDRNSLHEAHFFLIKAYVENNPVVVKEN